MLVTSVVENSVADMTVSGRVTNCLPFKIEDLENIRTHHCYRCSHSKQNGVRAPASLRDENAAGGCTYPQKLMSPQAVGAA